MISPRRLGHVFVQDDGPEVVLAWVEGGGQPIVRAPATTLQHTYQWALANAAEGVLVRRRGEPQAYWQGPGDIPFNKADLLPISQLRPRVITAGGWSGSLRPVHDGSASHLTYWSDRAWWSLNPDATCRHRPLGDGELEELLQKAGRLYVGRADLTLRSEPALVVVSRHDMFLERGLHLRGMIREREVAELDDVFTDAEDAVNPNFLAGPPRGVESLA